jgi:hypothetical protein
MRKIKLLILLGLATLQLTLFAAAEGPKAPEGKRRGGGSSGAPDKPGRWNREQKKEDLKRPAERAGAERTSRTREERPGGRGGKRDKASAWDRRLQKVERSADGKLTEREKSAARNRVDKARKWEQRKTVEPRAEQLAKMREHVFQGWINKEGKPVGFHYEGGAKPPKGMRITRRWEADSRGVYKARMEARVGKKKDIKDTHTFFPKSWTPAQVEKAIWEAHANREHLKHNIYRGTTSDGMVIEMKLNKDQIPRTAYPKREGDQ